MLNSKYTNSYSSDNKRLISNPLLPEDAQRAVRLVEERGVAGCPYKKEIDAIVQWLADATKVWYKDNQDKQEFQIKIPYKLSSKIDFLPIDINVTLRLEKYVTHSGGGATPFSINNRTGKINAVIIDLNGWFDSTGRLIRRTLLGPLYHEINHVYDAYYSSLSYNKDRFKNSLLRTQISSNNKILNWITYRLFSETELNAVVASVYGDLEGMNSDRQNFANDIVLTQAYQLYYEILQDYRNAIDNLSYEEGGYLLRQLRQHDIKFNIPIHSLGDLKKALKQKTAFCLKKLIKNIGRAASLWYDRKEAEKIKSLTEISTENHPIN